MDNPIFTKSDTFTEEYSASIVRIGKLEDIPGSDFLKKTVVNGYQTVVSNSIKEGDIMIYAKNETCISKDFLSVNNRFDIAYKELNKNCREVEALLAEGKEDEAKKQSGYFSKSGRVKTKKLRGCQSYGVLFDIQEFINWKPQLVVDHIDFNKFIETTADGTIIPFNFDTIYGEKFCKAFIPDNLGAKKGNKETKRVHKANKFDRIIPGQFRFHYDTKPLPENMWRIKPDTSVSISVKMHGTSFICAKVKTKKPIKLKDTKNVYKQTNSIIETIKALFKGYYIDYDNITSSRAVIKNTSINPKTIKNFYGVDVWSAYGALLYPYLLKGMTIYGEICGYVNGSKKLIQPGYDYGCLPGDNFLMIYRITYTNDKGVVTEWDLPSVDTWTRGLLNKYPELKQRVRPPSILYVGTLAELYPSIPTKDWNANVLQALKGDTEILGMELQEPMCVNNVPREGIVLRINGNTDPTISAVESAAYKLKTDAFLSRESKHIDKGEIDTEMVENTKK